MGRGEGPKRGHMYTGLHGKRGGAKDVLRSTWEEGRGQRGVTCTQVCKGRGEGPKRGHLYIGLHGKRGGANEGSHVNRSTWEEGRGQRGVTCMHRPTKRGLEGENCSVVFGLLIF